MHVIEIEPVTEQEDNVSSAETCQFVERVLFWIIVFVLVLLIVLFCGEWLQLMRTRNAVMQHEYQELLHISNEHTHYKPLEWMP
mgnify:CR=1 FL=1